MKHEWNDFGNAERVIAKYGHRLRWVRDERKGGFTVYDDRKWEAFGADTTIRAFVWDVLKHLDEEEAGEYDDTGPLDSKGRETPSERDKFLAWAKSQKSAGAVDSCMRVLNAHPGLLAWPGEFDRERFLLNFENGTMDTNTMEFAEHDPGDFQTRMMPVAYNPGADCPRWKAFLEETIPDAATREYVQKVVGYTLTGRSNEKIIMWLYGPANTGKSIVVNTLAKLFGQDYGVTANDNALRPKRGGGPSPEVHSMKGKRYVTTSETGHGEEIDEALVKRLTGGDTQNSRGLYQNESNWDPECVIWVASNAFPQPRGDDDAIWGRFGPVEFTEAYGPDNPRRNPMLPQELEAELEGMAAWAVEGLRMYLRDGLGDVPHVMQMTATKFMDNADQVRRFIFEAEEAGKINLTVDGQCVRTDLYKVYSEWAKVSGVGALGSRRFYERLASVPGISRTDKMSSGKRYVSGVNLITASWNAAPGWNGYP